MATSAQIDPTPSKCPTCGTAIPQGAVRCPACGRVFGEANRCPHCNAIAGVLPKGAGYVCAACGKPRERRSGTTVLDAAAAATASGVARRAGMAGLRTLGAVGIGGGVLLAIVMAMLFPGALGIALAIALGGVGVGVGAVALKAASAAGVRFDARERAERELAILELAEAKGGRLRVTDVARGMSMTTEEADATLTELARDPSRVSVDVDSNGVLSFVFLEVAGRARPRVRIGEPGTDEELGEEESSEQAVEELEAEEPRERARRRER